MVTQVAENLDFPDSLQPKTEAEEGAAFDAAGQPVGERLRRVFQRQAAG